MVSPRRRPVRAASVLSLPSLLLLLTVLGCAIYGNALRNPFVFDDRTAIVENPTLRSVAGSLRGGPVQSPTAGRPVPNLLFALNHAAGGEDPWGYHAVNLALHVICAGLLFALSRWMLEAVGDREASAVAASVAVLWLAHPLQSEVITYVTQRTEQMMALCALTALYAGLRETRPRASRGWSMTAVIACALGMASKESMVVVPLLLLLADAVLVSGGPARAVRNRPLFYACLAMTWGVLLALNLSGPRARSAGFGTGVNPLSYLLNQAPQLLHYARLVLWPGPLVLDYGPPVAMTLRAAAPAGAVVLLALAVTAVALWRRPAIGALGVSMFLLLAPTSSVVPIATEVGAERRMYLPLAPLLLLAVLGVRAAWRRWGPPPLREHATAERGLTGLVLLLLVAAYGARVVARNAEFRSPVAIWETVVARHPHSRAHYNLGVAYAAVGRRTDAVAAYTRAVTGTPEAHYALGFELDAEGRYADAAQHYRAFIAARPDDANVLRAWHQLGRDQIALQRWPEAIDAFQQVLTRQPSHVDAQAGLADALLGSGALADAAAAFERYLALAPRNAGALFNLGLIRARLQQPAAAADAFRAVLRLDPRLAAAHVNLAAALEALGQPSAAVDALGAAIALETDADARAALDAARQELLRRTR